MANVIQIVINALNKTGQGLTAPIKDLQALGKSLDNLKPAAYAMGTAVAASAVYMAHRFLETADSANKASQAIGMSTEAFTSLAYAANLGGLKSEEFQKGLAKLAQSMASAAADGGKSAKVFQDLGVAFANSDGTLRSVDDVFLQLADRFSKMQDGAAKTAAAMDLFGRGGSNMIPILNAGAAGLRDMQAEADALGVTITTQAGSAAERFNDALTRLQASTQGMVNIAMSELTPALADLVEGLVRWEKESGVVRAAAWTLVDVVKALGNGAAVAWAGLNALGMTLAYIADVIYSMLAVQVNVAIQLFQRWATAISEVGTLVKRSAVDIQNFASGLSALARGDYANSAALMSAAYAGAKDDAKTAFAEITAAAKDSAGIVAGNTAQFLNLMGERWKSFSNDQVANVASMMQRISAITTAGSSPMAPRTPAGSGGDGAGTSGNDGSAWINQIIEDSYKAADMLRQLQIAALEGTDQMRAAEMAAYQEKLSQIDGLAIYEDQKRQLREAAEIAHSQKMVEITRRENSQKLQSFSMYTAQFGSMMGSLAQVAAASGKKNFQLSQALRYGEAIMNTAAGVSRAFADYKWPMSMVVAAAVGAAGAAQIATIAAQKAPSYAVGSEFIPATGPAVVHQGERIVQSNINRDLTEFLDRQQGGPTHVTIMLDGEVLARALGNMSRDGRLELSARAVA